MHRVLNFGSALQAYALQQKLFALGCDNEIIDYVYPNELHERKSIVLRMKMALASVLNLLCGSPRKRRNERFGKFYEGQFVLSERQYRTKAEIDEAPPTYGLYLTGSDQVWNPRFVGTDTTFMFSFAKDANPRASYASSFATDRIPSDLKQLYAGELSKYCSISVRERSGVPLVRDLVGKEATVVCDPTLLLTRDEWKMLGEKSEIRVGHPYLLVYILDYSYNPYPEIDRIVRRVREKLNLHTVFLIGRKADYFTANSSVIKDAGPNEFVGLFMNASFVITTSFHGTAFALNFGIPFYSVIKDFSNADSRMLSLLQQVGAEERAVLYNDCDFRFKEMSDYESISSKLNQMREESISYLREVVK